MKGKDHRAGVQDELCNERPHAAQDTRGGDTCCCDVRNIQVQMIQNFAVNPNLRPTQVKRVTSPTTRQADVLAPQHPRAFRLVTNGIAKTQLDSVLVNVARVLHEQLTKEVLA